MAILLTLLLWWAILLIAGLLTALWVHQDPERARALALEARGRARLVWAAALVRLEDLRSSVRTRSSPRIP